MMRVAISILLMFACVVRGEIIPSTRRITWQGNVGVEGGIPDRTTIFANVRTPPWNAAANPSIDDTAVIQAAINACPSNQVVYIPAGRYRIQNTLQMKTGVTLRGDGMTNTVLMFTGAQFYGIRFFNPADLTYDMQVTSGFGKGSTNLTLSSAANYQIGYIVLVDQLNDSTLVNLNGSEGPGTRPEREFTRTQGQYSEIKDKAGNVITIWPPLSWEMTNSLSPRAFTEVGSGQGAVKFAGIESLTLTNAITGTGTTDMINMWRTANCWLKNVEVRRTYQKAVTMRKGFRTEIRGCSFIDTSSPAPGSSASYCVHGDYTSSFNLVEDNISSGLLNMAMWEYNASHNVVAHNFATNGVYYDSTWMAADYSIHAVHPSWNLFEGNIGDLFEADFIHGSGSHNTLLRNYFRGRRPGKTDHNICVCIDSFQRYYNLVGNILGNELWNNTTDYYERSGGVFSPGADKTIYRLGYKGVNFSSQGYDPVVLTSLMRHGNWDSRNETIVWDDTIIDHAIPSSYYLAAKPGWWGTNYAWPAIGSDITPMVGMNPAQRRYLGIPEGGGATLPTVRTLTVSSSNPGSGVAITVSPADNNAQASGTTPFARLYNDGASVTLIAPATVSGNSFTKWQTNGVDYATSPNTTVAASSDLVVTAFFTTPPAPATNKVTAVNVRVVR